MSRHRQRAPPAVTPWVVQIAAVDSQDAALGMLDTARDRVGAPPAQRKAVSPKRSRPAERRLHRARFSGFETQSEARDACRQLERRGVRLFRLTQLNARCNGSFQPSSIVLPVRVDCGGGRNAAPGNDMGQGPASSSSGWTRCPGAMRRPVAARQPCECGATRLRAAPEYAAPDPGRERPVARGVSAIVGSRACPWPGSPGPRGRSIPPGRGGASASARGARAGWRRHPPPGSSPRI